MWSCKAFPDPLEKGTIILAECGISSLSSDLPSIMKLEEETVKLAVADFVARRVPTLSSKIESLDAALRGKRSRTSSSVAPYVLLRSDVWCSDDVLYVTIRVKDANAKSAEQFTLETLSGWVVAKEDLMKHIACCVFQHRLRQYLSKNNFVAFLADGAILPRKSGASQAPMCSPPAVPFKAPEGSNLQHTAVVEMGIFKPFLHISSELVNGDNTGIVEIHGMAIPAGITLIAGGGYHGKSTMLRTIAAGVYNKVPGDGREFCVTVHDAVSVRAEDGRYVSKCNVSAFISNLPTLPGAKVSLDTKKFSTREASGSTSQAANVVEAIEMGATALLVDEDVSAANFMARDGRMRALVMDESITPLLYRVNGLFNTHGISSVVVVGGVGDWLDVPHRVILMDKYIAFDATAKANSISRQFSYGHVQYGGRGVVHRLEWEKDTTPIPRRFESESVSAFGRNLSVHLVEGGGMIAIDRDADKMQEHDDDDDSGHIDMTRCEQLLAKKPQLYGCGLCVAWILELAQREPELGLAALLQRLKTEVAQNGLASLCSDQESLLESVGYASCPRMHEVYMALTRIRGLVLEEIPVEDDGSEEAARREEERRKQELAALWNARRKKNRFDD
jgi:hypothetical protein